MIFILQVGIIYAVEYFWLWILSLALSLSLCSYPPIHPSIHSWSVRPLAHPPTYYLCSRIFLALDCSLPLSAYIHLSIHPSARLSTYPPTYSYPPTLPCLLLRTYLLTYLSGCLAACLSYKNCTDNHLFPN